MSFDYDAIVIGSGFGGAVVAHRLAQKGRKVLVFERGRKLSLDHKVPKLADVFPTQVDIRSAAGQKYSTSNFPYEITRADGG